MNIDGTYHQIFICWSEKVDVSWGHFHLLDRYIRRIDALLPEDMEDLVRPMSYKPNQEQTTRSRCQMSSDVIRCHQMSSDVTFFMPQRSVWFPSQHAVDPVCQEHQDYLSRCHGGASWHQRGGSEKLPGTNCAKIHCAGMDIRGRPSKWWTLLWYPQVIEHSYGKSPLLMGIYHL